MMDMAVYIRSVPNFVELRWTTYDSSDKTDLGVGWILFEHRIPPVLGVTIGIWDFVSPPLQKNLTPFSSSLPNIWALPRFTRMFNDFSMTSGSISWNSVDIVVNFLV